MCPSGATCLSVVSVSWHHKYPTKRVGLVQSWPYHLIENWLVLAMMWLKDCCVGIKQRSLNLGHEDLKEYASESCNYMYIFFSFFDEQSRQNQTSGTSWWICERLWFCMVLYGKIGSFQILLTNDCIFNFYKACIFTQWLNIYFSFFTRVHEIMMYFIL